MLISYQWLSQYLPEKIEIEQLSEILTDIGLEVEGIKAIEAVPGNMKGFKIGKVLTCEKHPNADKLSVTTVDIGEEEPVQIVCGAPNVAAGQKVVVATVGSTIYAEGHDPFQIKKAKLRGEASHGMICSGKEINWNEDTSGILVLEDDAIIGKDAAEHFELGEGDVQFEIGLTPNRSDAFSHIGTAKDVVAYWRYHHDPNWEVQWPETVNDSQFGGDKSIELIIENSDKAPYYSGVILDNIEIKDSPKWIQEHLKAIGLKPLNNVVDITNYVLHEFGQPLHAFDMEALKSGKILVNDGFGEQEFVSLDEQKVKLDAEDLMITDGQNLLAIGGVYGGLNSGVNENTTSVFIECAYFDPKTIRKSSVRHQMRTDAALHFEKGVPYARVKKALERAVYLLEKYANAKVNSPLIRFEAEGVDAYRPLSLKNKYLQTLAGKAYNTDKVTQLFKDLSFEDVRFENDVFEMSIHQTHQDMHGAADLVEEVIRIDGLNNIPMPDQIQIPLNPMSTSHSRKEKEKVAQLLVGQSYYEMVTNSLVNGADFKDRSDLVPLLNSLSKGLDTLRPELMPSGLEAIAYNLNRQQDSLKFFEFAKTYHQPKEHIYTEKEWLGIWSTGYEIKDQWNAKDLKSDFFSAKQTVENILALLPTPLKEEAGKGNEWIWKVKKKEIASLVEVNAKNLKQFGIKQKVYFAMIDWKAFLDNYRKTNIEYDSLARFPKVERDLSLVVDEAINYMDIRDIIEKNPVDFLLDYNLFDVFSSEQLGKDKKAMAIKFHFQLKERTLKDKEVDAYMNKMMDLFTKDIKASIRS